LLPIGVRQRLPGNDVVTAEARECCPRGQALVILRV